MCGKLAVIGYEHDHKDEKDQQAMLVEQINGTLQHRPFYLKLKDNIFLSDIICNEGGVAQDLSI